MKIISRIFLFSMSFSCLAQHESVQYFGHRGCRGIMPENSIEGFIKSIELGVDGIELDVVVNKEKQLVISHEPYFQSSFCLDSNNNQISNENKWNIFEMTQDEIEQFDCGSKKHPNFKEQFNFASHKPLLRELFQHVDLSKTKILFEVKSNPKEYGKSQPYPEEFVTIILRELSQFQYFDNIIFMSFDTEILECLNKIRPQLKCIYLTYLPFKSVSGFLNDLTFTPFALGMHYLIISGKKSNTLHKKGIQLFSWTVNSTKVQKKLINKKVDGIITDYPNYINKKLPTSFD